MTISAWAHSHARALMRVEEGETQLASDLNSRTVQDCINSQSFNIPTRARFSMGMALTIAGHLREARACFEQAGEFALAAVQHEQDPGGWWFMFDRCDLMAILYGCQWLVRGEPTEEYLIRATEAQLEGMRRAVEENVKVDHDSYEELALLHCLTGNWSAAFEVVPLATNRPISMNVTAFVKWTPTRAKTIALAAQYLQDPTCVTSDLAQARIRTGVAAVLGKEFAPNSAPSTGEVFLWLCLPGALFGRQRNAWEVLGSAADYHRT